MTIKADETFLVLFTGRHGNADATSAAATPGLCLDPGHGLLGREGRHDAHQRAAHYPLPR